MPRTARIAPGNWIFHVLNRANGRTDLFETPADYRDFLGIAEASTRTVPMRILAYCLMPNHWHMLLWPYADGDLSRFLHLTTMRHTRRRHAFHHSTGRGHLYQGRYKSFAVRHDRHLLTVCRYIERNPLRAKLVARPEEWPWSSAAAHVAVGIDGADSRSRRGGHEQLPLASLPVDKPDGWRELLNEPQPNAEAEAIRNCLQRGYPYGDEVWKRMAAARLGLPEDERGPGRPRKERALSALG